MLPRPKPVSIPVGAAFRGGPQRKPHLDQPGTSPHHRHPVAQAFRPEAVINAGKISHPKTDSNPATNPSNSPLSPFSYCPYSVRSKNFATVPFVPTPQPFP